MLSFGKLRLVVAFFFVGWLVGTASAADTRVVGPEGGDVRRLAAVPDNPNRIFLGTSSGRLYVSNDRGKTWSQFAHLGQGFDYVLDSIEIDPTNSNVMYVAGWSIEGQTGELFRSRDGGKSWTSLPGVKGKSIRALALAPSNPKVMVVGALDGVFRSNDAGDSWTRISPENHASIKNIESIAIDPKDPNGVYAGTWHLAWKTSDGGKNWHQINRGMIDDSDVFSIIVDPKEPNVVYASACSGIYKSQTAGELFHKVPGIPFSSRRTRVLKQDPNRPNVVYAGTTEGLWRTENAGQTWSRISSANVIVNDILLDAAEPNSIMLATDRVGVLMSSNSAKTFVPSNKGFSHRQVASVIIDTKNANRLYAGTLNDRDAGGVFVSNDSGKQWQQMSAGLGGHDVFQVRQDPAGNLFAATNGGLFKFNEKTKLWMKVLPARMDSRMRVSDLDVSGPVWFLASGDGVFTSKTKGASWQPVATLGKQQFISVRTNGGVTAAASNSKVFVSTNEGKSWEQIHIPLVSYISAMTLDASGYVWMNSPQGVFRQLSDGWEKVRDLPQEKVAVLDFDRRSGSVVAITRDNNKVLVSNDGHKWHSVYNGGVPVRSVAFTNDRMFAGTTFDGVVTIDLNHNQRAAAADTSGGTD
jgi:photosystem II stability/assembly factor-like uncharacterized protein